MNQLGEKTVVTKQMSTEIPVEIILNSENKPSNDEEELSRPDEIYQTIKDNLASGRIYVFFGHGWNTKETFSIAHLNKVQIVMLKYSVCLVEDLGTRHLKNLMKVGIGGYNKEDYMRSLYETAAEKNNDLCVYDSKIFTEVPNLLLTTHTKNIPPELTQLHQVGDLRKTTLEQNVMLLSELVERLSSTTNDGGKFLLEIYACRSHLDTFQFNNLYVFGPEGEQDIINKIKFQELKLYSNTDTRENSPPCSDYSQYIR